MEDLGDLGAGSPELIGSDAEGVGLSSCSGFDIQSPPLRSRNICLYYVVGSFVAFLFYKFGVRRNLISMWCVFHCLKEFNVRLTRAQCAHALIWPKSGQKVQPG